MIDEEPIRKLPDTRRNHADFHATKELWRAVEAEGTENKQSCGASIQFPEEFLKGLRSALKAGWSCEQLTAFLVLVSGLYKSLELFGGDQLVTRARYIAGVMAGDIDEIAKQEALARRVKEKRRRLKAAKSRTMHKTPASDTH